MLYERYKRYSTMMVRAAKKSVCCLRGIVFSQKRSAAQTLTFPLRLLQKLFSNVTFSPEEPLSRKRFAIDSPNLQPTYAFLLVRTDKDVFYI